jgi:Protein of unknown function (DUF2817)
MTVSSIESPTLTSTNYFSKDYFEARDRFLNAMKSLNNFSFHEALEIQAKGPGGKPLYIDIVCLGPVDAENILIHLSATHGVEGHVGAAGQVSLGEDPIELPAKTRCYMIFGTNAFGYAWNRRVNESNVDLNRNLAKKRTSPALYEKIDHWMNPKKFMTREEFGQQLQLASKEHTWPAIKATVAGGQHDYPEGLFYGGKEVEEGPQLIIDWFTREFTGRDNSENLTFAIVDVHTGLGEERGEDTLLTATPPSLAVAKFFGEKMDVSAQKKTVGGYKPEGMLTLGLAEQIVKVTKCAKPLVIGQEFATVPVSEVLYALWAENMCWHLALRKGDVPDHKSEASLRLRDVFNLQDEPSQKKAVKRVRELFSQTLEYLQHARELS